MSAFPDLGNFKTHFLDFGFGLARGLPGIDLEFEKLFFKFGTSGFSRFENRGLTNEMFKEKIHLFIEIKMSLDQPSENGADIHHQVYQQTHRCHRNNYSQGQYLESFQGG